MTTETLNRYECQNKSGKAYGAWFWAQSGKFAEKPKADRVALILEYRKYRELAKTAPLERNGRGNIVHRDHDAIAALGLKGKPQSRYDFDFNLCANGSWLQYDTDQDASYFGQWVNPHQMKFLCYAEGDVTLIVCESPEGYNKELEACAQFYGAPPASIVAIDLNGQVTKYYQERPQAI